MPQSTATAFFELYGIVEEIIRPPVDARLPILWVTEIGQQDAFQPGQLRLMARSSFQRVLRQTDNFNAVKIVEQMIVRRVSTHYRGSLIIL